MKKRVFVYFPNEVADSDMSGVKDALNRLGKVVTVSYGKRSNEGISLFSRLPLWFSDACLQVVTPGMEEISGAKEILIRARKKNLPILTITIEEFKKKDEEQFYLLFDDVEKRGLPVGLVCLFSVLVCSLICYLGIKLSYNWIDRKPTPEGLDSFSKRGLFGDSWGGVNAIVSAFAFAGVIVTLFLQNRDLNLQRKEMARQREEFEKENETLKYQRFESLFYNMLNLQQRIVDGLKAWHYVKEISLVPLSSGGQGYEEDMARREISGREVFKYKFEEEEHNGKVKGLRSLLLNEGLDAYDNYWGPTAFDHYFRHLYKMLQFIDEQGFEYGEAYRYASFLRGTLSRYELVWIYYNALFNPKFKVLIEKYSFLKNIRPDLLATTIETKKYYEGLGIKKEDLIKKKFFGTDYEFYMTDDPQEEDKYQLSAFWKFSELEEGKQYYRSWKDFISEASEAVIEHV